MDYIDHRYAVVGKVVYRSFEVCQIFGSQSIHSSRMYFHIDYRTRSASSPLKIYCEIFTDLSCNITVEKDGKKKLYKSNFFPLNFCFLHYYTFFFQQYNHTSWSYNPPPVVPLGRGDIGKPNNTDDDYNISPRWKTFVTNNEGKPQNLSFLDFSPLYRMERTTLIASYFYGYI